MLFYDLNEANDNRLNHANRANHPWFESVVDVALCDVALQQGFGELILEIEKLLGSRLEAEGATLEMSLTLKYPVIGPHRPFGKTVMRASRGVKFTGKDFRPKDASNDDTTAKQKDSKMQTA